VVVVELLTDRARELIDERLGVDEVEGVDALADDLRGRSHQLEIRFHLAWSLGALHLDDDLIARGQRGSVHLADRGGRERGLVEREECLLDRQPDLRLDDTTNLDEGDGCHIIL
jgi:hypothetical protein